MNELESLRREIDRVDKELLPLFLERMSLCAHVADYKRSNDMPVLDSVREKQVLDSKMDMLPSSEMSEEVYEFFNSLMTISRIHQEKKLSDVREGICSDVIKKSSKKKHKPTVACFGYEGSYSEEAAEKFFGGEFEKTYVRAFRDGFEAVESGTADYTVLPIENSSTGMIAEVMDILAEKEFYITGEAHISVRHCLLANKGTEISDIRKIYSHEQALMQCQEFTGSLKADCISFDSTALAARAVSEMKSGDVAAIASERTAKIYGLEVLKKGINTVDCNTTRFVVISAKPEISETADKISTVFTLEHKSGELCRVLSAFARGGLNLLKLESRPVPEKPFEYKFFADYSGNLNVDKVRKLTDDVAAGTKKFVLLGNYVNADKEHK